MAQAKPYEQIREIVVVGCDSETQAGPPISLQFHSYDAPALSAMYQVDATSATRTFFKHLRKMRDPDKHYRVYGHYLEFDMLSFLWSKRLELVGNHGAFEFSYGEWNIEGCYGRPTFARITTARGVLIELVDSALWFRGSLDQAAQQYCPELKKLPRPEGLGERWFFVTDKEFAAYAMRDAEIAARLGALVEGFHQKRALKPSMSLASQASQIFRREYITTPIVQCPAQYIEPAIMAYHGGKNNLVNGCAPAWHYDVSMYDLSSAYPWAMTELPDFSDADGYQVRVFPKNAKSVPVPGVYLVTGMLARCSWPIFFSHSFQPLQGCRVEQLWVHGYELNEALASGEFAPSERIHGCCYIDTTGNESATSRFAKDLYKQKSTAENPIDRYMYKILLNSLSGKFVQTRPVDRMENNEKITEHVAGGLFQPFIAGAITAHTRATMHQVEHAYKAIHTATDGIIAPTRKRRPKIDALPATGLGSLQCEMSGNIVLLRTKLYIGYEPGQGAQPSSVYRDWSIKKYALHGFQGTVKELEEMVATNRRWYVANHRIGLREAVKHGTTPNNFIRRSMNLQVGRVAV